MILKSFPNERQMDVMDCGPACLKIITKYYGQYYSLPYLRDLCGITKEGVSMADIGYASEKLGIKSLAARCSMEEVLNKIPLPSIIHWNNSHFVVLYKVKKKESSPDFSFLILQRGW